MICFKKEKRPQFEVALSKLKLPPLQQAILEERYIKLLDCFQKRAFRLALFFHLGRFIITVGSLIVPALLSIQYTNTDSGESNSPSTSFQYRIYWATWIVSLLVTTSNGVLSIFKVDKKYYYLHTSLEQLRSEGWQYLELSGRYSGFFTPNTTPTHDNQFIYFCNVIEKIKMKQVEEEYYKLMDAQQSSVSTKPADSSGAAAGAATQLIKKVETSLIPPTPLNNILAQAQSLPADLLNHLVLMAQQQQQQEQAKQKPEEKVEGSDSNENKKNEGATAPPLPMLTDMQEYGTSQKNLL